MPRKISINQHPNPTGLTMGERQLALDILQSLRVGVARLRKEYLESCSWREWTAKDEIEAWDRVVRAAINQFAGRQKSNKGNFELVHNDSEVLDRDLEYVMKSLSQGQTLPS